MWRIVKGISEQKIINVGDVQWQQKQPADLSVVSNKNAV